MPDRFDLYELCVQSPSYDARMLAAIHAAGGRKRARVLGEDFCGTAALSRAWIDLDRKGHRAVAVDHDAETLVRALELNAAPTPDAAGGKAGAGGRAGALPRPGITYALADVLETVDRVDILCALNYSIGEFHDRRGLVRYLRHARKRVRAGGSFICDMYTGRDSMLTGVERKRVSLPTARGRGRRGNVEYEWEQREANPLTGMVVNAIHFRLLGRKARGDEAVMRDAFVYRWRLWSVPELREAMLEAGFGRTQVYPRHAEAIDGEGRFHALPFDNPEELPESFNAYIVGRV
jgi:SAM-dependent methyltransferase